MVFSNVLLPVMPAILNSGTIYLSTNTGPEDYNVMFRVQPAGLSGASHLVLKHTFTPSTPQ